MCVNVCYTTHHNIQGMHHHKSSSHRFHTQGPSNPRMANRQQGRGFSYSMASLVGTASPARNPLPLTRASMPPLARYIRKLPLHRPTCRSSYTQLTQGAGDEVRPCDASGVRGFVSELMQELHRRLSDTSVRLHGEGDEGVLMLLLLSYPFIFFSETSRYKARNEMPFM
jgi:hypothetical protein